MPLTDIHQKLHKTCIALRQLFNTRDTTQSLLPYGSLGGDGFGIPYLKLVLSLDDCQLRFGYTINELEHKFLTATTSTNKADDMAAFVRWATDIAIGFVCDDPAQVATRARRGVEIVPFVQENLQIHTSAVYNAVKNNGEREEQLYRLLLLFLGNLINAINKHHKQVSDSNAGIEELFTVGDETAFVRRGSNTPEDIRKLYTTVIVEYGMAKHQFIDMAEQVITRRVKEQKHPMPVEYAVRILASAIPTLNPALLQRLPVQQWLDWTKDLRLENVGEEIATGVKERLSSGGEELHAPRDLTSEWIQNAAPSLQSATPDTTGLLAGMGNPDTGTAKPTTLFGKGWAGVQVLQDPNASQSQSSQSIALPPKLKMKAKRSHAERLKAWKDSPNGRGEAAGKPSKLSRFLEDFRKSKVSKWN